MKSATLEDLSWFKLDNYKACKDFNSLDWSNFLLDRLHALDAVGSLECGTSAIKVRIGGRPVDGYSELCSYIQSGNPLEFSFSETVRSLIGYGSGYSPFWDEDHMVKAIEPLSIARVKEMAEDLKNSPPTPFFFVPSLPKWSSVTGLRVSLDDNEKDIPYDWVKEEWTGDVHIGIDLSSPDKVILEEMRQFLPRYREALRAKKGYSGTGWGKIQDSDIKKLCSYNALPYLDLCIWAGAKGLEVKDVTFAHLLSPRDVTDYRQTEKKFYKKVLCYDFVRALEKDADTKLD